MVAGKVGQIDDPIWRTTADPPVPTLRSGSGHGGWRHRIGLPWLLAGLFVVLVVTGVTVALALPSGHAGGDPGGRLLARLEGVARSATPPSAVRVERVVLDSFWSRACPDNPSGRDGWSEVLVTLRFDAAGSERQLDSAVGAVLGRSGWHLRGTGPDNWSRALVPGVPAFVFLYRDPSGARQWTMTFAAQPPGYALPGC